MKASLCCLAKSVYLLFCSLSKLDHQSPKILVIPLFSRFGYFSLTNDLCLLQKSKNAFMGRFCSLFAFVAAAALVGAAVAVAFVAACCGLLLVVDDCC